MGERLTHAKFAQLAASMAGQCAQWAHGALNSPEKLDEPITALAARCFIDEMQVHLDALRKHCAALEPRDER